MTLLLLLCNTYSCIFCIIDLSVLSIYHIFMPRKSTQFQFLLCCNFSRKRTKCVSSQMPELVPVGDMGPKTHIFIKIIDVKDVFKRFFLF